MPKGRINALDYDPKTGKKDEPIVEPTKEDVVAKEAEPKKEVEEAKQEKEVLSNKEEVVLDKDGNPIKEKEPDDFWTKASERLGRTVEKEEDFFIKEEVQVEVEKVVEKQYATEFSKKYDKYWKEFGGTPSDFIEASVSIKELTPEQIVKKALKKNNPNFSQDDVEFDFKDTYGVDEDVMDENEIHRRQLSFKKAVNTSTKELESFQKDFFVSNENSLLSIEKQQKEASETRDKNSRIWRDAVEKTNSELDGFDIKIADDFSFTQKYSQEDLGVMKKVVSDDSFKEWTAKYANEQGMMDTSRMQQDEYIRNNFSKIIETVAKQARAYERGEIKKQDKHINFKTDNKPKDNTLPKHVRERNDLLAHKFRKK